ncbi:MAG TPA: hypothetical protein VFH27_04720 [Longimicrobiaceae bacterium]|nr:hypothetical protein [Longimicrobiaceae bacterium]
MKDPASLTPTSDTVPAAAANADVGEPAAATTRQPLFPRFRLERREVAIVAAFALGTMGGVALLLRLAFGAADSGRFGRDALRPVGTPPADRCALRRSDGLVVGRVVGLMGRGDRVEAYRVAEWPGNGVAPAASTLNVPVGEVRLEPCSTLAPTPSGAGR